VLGTVYQPKGQLVPPGQSYRRCKRLISSMIPARSSSFSTTETVPRVRPIRLKENSLRITLARSATTYRECMSSPWLSHVIGVVQNGFLRSRICHRTELFEARMCAIRVVQILNSALTPTVAKSRTNETESCCV
jgi:hypothetical protein